MSLTGAVAGPGNLTKTGGGTVALQQPAYSGNTTVSGGTLRLAAATLPDGGRISIAAGARLHLAHDADDTVDTLVLGGVSAAAGTWGATGSGAEHPNDEFFTGTGTLRVSSGGTFTVASHSLLPTAVRTGNSLVFSFQRDDAAEGGGVQVAVRHGDDLVNWTTVPVRAASTASVTVQENGDEPDTVKVVLPEDGPRKFARLQVIVSQ